ncbi:MAG: PQQ-dependent sugar dehydrogenase [Candidatus Nanopelagicaceae bacterium]
MISALPRIALVFILAFLQIFAPAVASEGELKLSIESQDIDETLVESSRGAALAVLSDGSLLLGGGSAGNLLYRYKDSSLQLIGELYSQSERIRDSRFGPTDIAVLKQDVKGVDVLISYPQLNGAKNCVRLVVFRYSLNLEKKSIIKRERWFQGKPCVPIGAVQHAAGRIEILSSKSAYLTTGDLGFRRINQVTARGYLGGVFKISKNKIVQISRGHRNPQGIIKVGNNLYISEHGPRGGDELNLIEANKDYGWPFVTYGKPYTSGDYVIPAKTGTHVGYQEPIYQWSPSVAPTELVLLPKNSVWGDLSNYIVMGTLASQSLIFIELQSPSNVGKIHTYLVNERLRDLEVLPTGELVATTDGESFYSSLLLDSRARNLVFSYTYV